MAAQNPHAISPDEAIREQWARQQENERDNTAVAWANEKLLGRGLVLSRHNLFDNPELGRFVIKKISDGTVVAANISPQRLAASLNRGG